MFKSLLKFSRGAVRDELPPAAAGARPRRVDPETLLRRMEWTVIRRLDGLLQGDYRTLLRGFGLDLADLREYQGHDDVRYIDWNVTARMGVPHVRQFHEDREVFAWFVLDLSGSVDFGSEQVRKRELSSELVAVLGRILTRHGNRVGAVLHSGKTGWNRPLTLLARRHEVVAVRLYDPLENELPDLGLVIMQDAETGEQLFVDTRDGSFRRRFMQVAERRESELRDGLAGAGVDCLELATDDPLGEALLRFTGLRKRRSQLAAGAGNLRKPIVS
jgi:uncharacterized protein (DUF58 family)